MADVNFLIHIVAQWRAEQEVEDEAKQKERQESRMNGRRVAKDRDSEVPFDDRLQRQLWKLAKCWESEENGDSGTREQTEQYCAFFTRVFLSAFKRQNRQLFVKVVADTTLTPILRQASVLRLCRAHLFRIYVGLALPFRPHGALADGAHFGLPSDVMNQIASYLPLRPLRALGQASRDLLRICHATLAAEAVKGDLLLHWVQPKALILACDADFLASSALAGDHSLAMGSGARDAMAVACTLVFVEHAPRPVQDACLSSLLELAKSQESHPLQVLLSEVSASPTIAIFEECLHQYFGTMHTSFKDRMDVSTASSGPSKLTVVSPDCDTSP